MEMSLYYPDMNIKRWILRKFFNFFFKIKRPETVKYWEWGEMRRARTKVNEKGIEVMEIENEKYDYPGYPRGHILYGPLAGLKKTIKERIFNEVFAELEAAMDGMKYDMMPVEKMVPAVQELWRVFEEIENAEVTPDMKGRIALIKKILCFFLQEDDAYRFRLQWAFERLDPKKMKLTKADEYYFRGKYFKVDHDIYDY